MYVKQPNSQTGSNTEGQNPPITRVGVIAVVGVAVANREGAPNPCLRAPHILIGGKRTTVIAAAATATVASVARAIRPTVDQVSLGWGGVLRVGVAAGVVGGGEGESKAESE